MAASPSSSRARTGRRPGPTTTREAILEAARERFAAVGYDRATFRQIAARAGVDPALVVQFFGSKPDLFAAAVEIPPEMLAQLATELDAEPGTAGAAVARVLMGWLEDPRMRTTIIARIRSAATEPAAAEIVRRAVASDLGSVVRSLGSDRPDVRAGLVGSHFVGIVMAREVVRLPSLAGLSGDELVALIAPTFQRYLTGPLESAAVSGGEG